MDKWARVAMVFTLTWGTVAIMCITIWPNTSIITWYLTALCPAGIVSLFYARGD